METIQKYFEIIREFAYTPQGVETFWILFIAAFSYALFYEFVEWFSNKKDY